MNFRNLRALPRPLTWEFVWFLTPLEEVEQPLEIITCVLLLCVVESMVEREESESSIFHYSLFDLTRVCPGIESYVMQSL